MNAMALSPEDEAVDATAATAANELPPAAAHLRGDSLRAGVLVLLMATAAQRLVGLARGVLFCRWLPAEELGQWDMAYGFLLLAAPAVVLGLPGSFGRYVEYYRQRGQLRAYLRRATGAVVCLTSVAIATLALGRREFATIVFGVPSAASITLALAAVLGAVILQNTVTALLTALRMVRVAAAVQFANSLAFAVAGVALLLLTDWGGMAVAVAFGIACVFSGLGGVAALRTAWRELPVEPAHLPGRELWARLLPFALWLWLTNWLTNLFDVSDRYLLLHFGGFSESEALAQIGQYHSARLIPMTFLGLAELFGAVITPYLTADWERNRREEVSHRLNDMIVAAACAVTSVGVCVLWCAPWLFEFAFASKYAQGLHVLPWTLASCCFTAVTVVAQNYLWCAERPRLPVAALAAGLAANIGLNLALLPPFGLWGTAVAAAIAHGLALLAMLGLNARAGMRVEGATLAAALLPGLLGVGPGWALGGLAGLGVWTMTGRRQEMRRAARRRNDLKDSNNG